jgi:polysaccharide export outer membrane protein
VQSFRVSVIGEVRRPDRYDLRGRATVLDALAMAGGFAEFAARTRVVILRHNGTTVKRIPFNYNAIVSANGERTNFFLEPGDIILVP